MIERSIEVVADYYSLPVETLLDQRWRRHVVPVRQRAMYLAYQLSQETLASVGAWFGRTDGASIWYPVLNVHLQAAVDHRLAGQLRGIARLIDTERASVVAWDERPRLRR